MIQNRYEFSILFDVKNGNPNGNPDADNMPRQDVVTGKGLITDVCLKHKIKQYIDLLYGTETGYNLFVKDKTISENEMIQTFIQHQILKEDERISDDTLKKAMQRLKKDTGELDATILELLCANYFDIRTFGAVLTSLSKVKTMTSSLRGPVQFNMAESIDPIMPQRVSITRTGAASEDYFKQAGYGTIGERWIVPYGLYRCNGYVSAALSQKQAGPTGTGALTEEDLQRLWEAITNMFEHDHAVARGEMNVRGLYIWKHDSKYGKVHAHRLFDTLTVTKKDGIVHPSSFSDYIVSMNESAIPESVTMYRYDE